MGATCYRDLECKIGLSCELIADKCIDPGASGSSCHRDAECGKGLVCDLVTFLCKAPGHAGASCSRQLCGSDTQHIRHETCSSNALDDDSGFGAANLFGDLR